MVEGLGRLEILMHSITIRSTVWIILHNRYIIYCINKSEFPSLLFDGWTVGCSRVPLSSSLSCPRKSCCLAFVWVAADICVSLRLRYRIASIACSRKGWVYHMHHIHPYIVVAWAIPREASQQLGSNIVLKCVESIPVIDKTWVKRWTKAGGKEWQPEDDDDDYDDDDDDEDENEDDDEDEDDDDDDDDDEDDDEEEEEEDDDDDDDDDMVGLCTINPCEHTTDRTREESIPQTPRPSQAKRLILPQFDPPAPPHPEQCKNQFYWKSRPLILLKKRKLQLGLPSFRDLKFNPWSWKPTLRKFQTFRATWLAPQWLVFIPKLKNSKVVQWTIRMYFQSNCIYLSIDPLVSISMSRLIRQHVSTAHPQGQRLTHRSLPLLWGLAWIVLHDDVTGFRGWLLVPAKSQKWQHSSGKFTPLRWWLLSILLASSLNPRHDWCGFQQTT